MAVAKLIVGNWKMNGLTADSQERAAKLASSMKGHKSLPFHMVLCPPATQISTVAAALKGSAIKWGGQDCHAEASGAFTGDVSAAMLKDLGCSYVIVGHSERRQLHQETSAMVAAKAKAAHAAGLIAIICVGETDAERTAGKADKIVTEQLKESIPDTATMENTVIAYEPVWAIGTGKVASQDDIKHMHALIRTKVNEKVKNSAWLPLLYGGSVKGGNAGEILHLANVDGVLVGGASLKAEEFWSIAQASAEG
jgi:triosephosphate isomerase (TIM)